MAVLRYRRRGVEVDVTGLHARSARLHDRLAKHDKPAGFEIAAAGH